MTKTGKRLWIFGALLAVLLALPSSVFVVHETEVGIVTRFGKPKADLAEPGLHFKLPWPVDHVLRLDQRLLVFDNEPAEMCAGPARRGLCRGPGVLSLPARSRELRDDPR